jgi:hypothetical protein
MDIAWYVSAQNQTFGPYSHEQMKAFAQDRRLAPQSLVRIGEDGAYVAASSHAALARCFDANGLQSGETGSARKASSDPAGAVAVATAPLATVPAEGQVSNFLILVQVRAGSQRDFEAAMKQLGAFFRLNAHVWMLQSERNANTIKMTLSPHVGSQDQLLVVDAARNRLAWHNISVHDASRMRELWKMPHER